MNCRYEVFLDEVKPQDLSLSFLREFMELPTTYFAAGAPLRFRKYIFSGMRYQLRKDQLKICISLEMIFIYFSLQELLSSKCVMIYPVVDTLGILKVLCVQTEINMIQITSTLQTPISVIVPQHFKIQCITRHLLMNSDEFYSGD